jgi:hypothetical protein
MTITRAIGVLVASLLVSVSVDSADESSRAVMNRPPALITTNWHRIDLRALSFHVPPGMTNVSVQGIDSLVGRCQSTNMLLTLDYGRYSSSALREATTSIQVGGRPARILVSQLTSSDDSDPSAKGMTNYFLLAMPIGSNTLRFSIFYHDPNDLPVAKAIADSVRFSAEPPSPANRP